MYFQSAMFTADLYKDWDKLKLHIDIVLGPLGACLAPEVAELDRIEIHAPTAELPTIKEHGALQANEAKMQYSEIGWGFRNATGSCAFVPSSEHNAADTRCRSTSLSWNSCDLLR